MKSQPRTLFALFLYTTGVYNEVTCCQLPFFCDQMYHADTCEPLKRAVEKGEVCLAAHARGAYPGRRLLADVPEVRTVGYWDADQNQSWGLDWHRNEGIELTYVARGKVHFSVDQQTFHLKHGDLTITRPWQIHRVGNPTISACRLHWLILDVGIRRPNQPWVWPKWLASSGEDIAWLTRVLRRNENPVWEANDEIGHYFERLGEITATEAMESNESRLKLYISGLFVALTDVLRRQCPCLDQHLSSTYRAVELFLSDLVHSADQPWTLDSMAQACGLGRSRFAYYCKAITNMSPGNYLTACRIQAAKKLLLQRVDWNITAIALYCGFTSGQYFATIFHECVGCSPHEFRLQSGSVAKTR